MERGVFGPQKIGHWLIALRVLPWAVRVQRGPACIVLGSSFHGKEIGHQMVSAGFAY